MKHSSLVKYVIIFVVGFGLGVSLYYLAARSDQSETQRVIDTNSYQQETEYSCGGAVIKTLLDYFNRLNGRSEAEISKALGTGFGPPNPGTHPDQMLEFLKADGFEVVSGENASMDLVYHYLDQNVPVIALDSTWGGHWRLIVGYDFNGDKKKWENNDVIFADPEHKTVEPNVDNEKGLITENESRFFYEWYENRLFERPREKFYVVAYPSDMIIVPYRKNT